MLGAWFPIAIAHAADRGFEVEPILRAFGSEASGRIDASRAGDFGALDVAVVDRAQSLELEIVAALDEVDDAQARLFARRFTSVVGILGALESAERRVLRAGLVCRVVEILAAPRPRALRVRAVCDFYYSQAALVHHRGQGAPIERLLSEISWRELDTGLHHAHVAGLSDLGPVNLNLLRLRGGHIRTVDCRGHDFAQFVAAQGASAGVSGGFFLYSESDIEPPSRRGDPVGMLVDGRLRPPVFRRATLMQRDGEYLVERVGLVGTHIAVDEERILVAAVNDETQMGEGAVLFNRAWGRELRAPGAFAVVDDRVVGVTTGTDPLLIPLAGFVLVRGKGDEGSIRIGSKVEYGLPDGLPSAAMAGGPLLLGEEPMDLEREDFRGSAPPATFSSDETFDENLLPRMAAGLGLEGELYFCAVDGRNFEQAPGFTLAMTARCLSALGCVRAMNLDGGGSKRMVVEGRVVDLPSTEVVTGPSSETRVRPVRSGILLFASGDKAGASSSQS